MESLLQDLRHAARSLRRAGGFTIVALAALALGIGANTAVFSVIRATVLTPSPFRDASRLVMLTERATAGDPIFPGVSFADYEDWRTSARAFDGLGWFTWTRGYNLTGGDVAERVSASLVTHELFSMLGVAPALGRTFGPEDDRPGAAARAAGCGAGWSWRKSRSHSSCSLERACCSGTSWPSAGSSSDSCPTTY